MFLKSFFYMYSRYSMRWDEATCQVSAVAGVAGGHHVPRVEHLLGQLGDSERPKQKCFVKLTFHDNFD